MTTPTHIGRPGRPVRWVVAGAAALSLLGVAACGTGGAAPSGSTGGAAGHGARRQQMQAYSQCLSQHGVTLPKRGAGTPPGGAAAPASGAAAPAGAHPHRDPSQPPPGVDPQAWSSARAACASVAPAPAAANKPSS